MAEVKNDAWLDAKEGDDHDEAEKEVTGDRNFGTQQNRSRNNRGFRFPIRESDDDS